MAAPKFLKPGFFSGGAGVATGELESIVNERVIHIGNFSDGTRPVLLATWTALGFLAIPGAGAVMIYNTSDNTFNVWDGTGWRDMAGTTT